MFAQDSTPPPLGWQVARLVMCGSSRQAFLGHRWISWLLAATPQDYRRALALRVLSLSPHYFIHQWDAYPAEWNRRRVLESEFDRNRHSRLQIADRLLASVVAGEHAVLDFGCGPGFLAYYVSQRVARVVALDVSAGVLACAGALNPGPAYKVIRGPHLPVDDASIDIVYSIAVFQHIDPNEWPEYFASFHRVLRTGGRGLCHFAIADGRPVVYKEPGGLRALYSLRFQESTAETVLTLLGSAGFVDVKIVPMVDVADIEDHVGHSYVASFTKPE